MMKRLMVLILVCSMLVMTAAMAENVIFTYRFADAEEAATLLLSNRTYYENLNQMDLDFRMQKKGATLEELEAFVPTQMLDFTDEEKQAIDEGMNLIENVCRNQGYVLPKTDGIVFVKTTMHEESDAGAYTHGTQIYLGERLMNFGISAVPEEKEAFQVILAHELFHCLTRNHPDFRKDMYEILGFTVVENDYVFTSEIQNLIISNPDVGHHNSYASFEIDGQKRDCAVIFTTVKQYEEPGDSFFDGMVTGLVPIDDLGMMYTSDEASNFWEVFGKNTNYVVDPEETLADNFSYVIIYGVDDPRYETPELIRAIDEYLKSSMAVKDAA